MFFSKSISRRTSWVPSLAKRETLLDIHIDRHFESKVYTSGSPVTGKVTLNSKTDLAFESFEVILTGATSAHIPLLQHEAPPSRHLFLRLKMPIAAGGLPDTRILEAGRSYSIHFAFVIPPELSTGACKHEDTIIHDRHVQPPPTIGSWEQEDLTTHSVRVEYGIRARLVLPAGKKGRTKFIDRCHPIRVIPSVSEQPPLHISLDDPMYRPSQSKIMRKHLKSPRVGCLTASLVQPAPIVLSINRLQASTSNMVLDLEFSTSSTEAILPEVYAKSAHIDATTTYSLGHLDYLPDNQKRPSFTAHPVAPYWSSHELILDKTETLLWERDTRLYSINGVRRCSEPASFGENSMMRHYSVDSCYTFQSEENSETEPNMYRARLLLPFRLPTGQKKLFLPTFHSCLVSRTYTIRLVLATRSHGATFCLTIPLQIVADGFGLVPETGLPGYVSIFGDIKDTNEADKVLKTQIGTEQHPDDSLPPTYENL